MKRAGSVPCVTWGSHEDARSPWLAGVGSSKWVPWPLPTVARDVFGCFTELLLRHEEIVSYFQGGPGTRRRPIVPLAQGGLDNFAELFILSKAFPGLRASALFPIFSPRTSSPPCPRSTCHIFICSEPAFLIDCGLYEPRYDICLIL